LTADVRIDNRDELLKALRPRHRSSEPITDAELVLQAYEKWGEACPEHLVGAYAFVLWDEREQKLFGARDHLGIKPLFYYRETNFFVFASELKALFVVPGVPRVINEKRVAEHLAVDPSDVETTFYEDIFHAPPAHSFTVSPNALSKRRYWTIDAQEELHLGSEEAYAEALREQFLEAVECRLRSAYPVGSALSGGLDSSSIACAARDSLEAIERGPLHAFSLVFPSFEGEEKERIDERSFMDVVLETGEFEPHFIRGDQHSPLEDLDAMLWHMDQAFWAPNLYLHWLMYSAAEANGVRVFLDGIDGDSTISHGRQYLSELAMKGAWEAFDHHVTALAEQHDKLRGNMARRHAYPVLRAWANKDTLQFMRGALAVSRQFNIPLREIASGIWLRENLPSWISRWMVGNSGTSSSKTSGRSLLRDDLAQKYGLTEKHLQAEQHVETLTTHREHHAKLFLDNTYPRSLDMADKTSAAFGLEARYPFHDRRLIELSVSFPAETKLKDGWTRYIFRRAMEGILPDAIRWRRRKARLGGNFDRGLLKEDTETLQHLLQRNKPLFKEFVDLEKLRNVDRTERLRTASMTFYTAATLSAWLEKEDGQAWRSEAASHEEGTICRREASGSSESATGNGPEAQHS